MKSLRICRRYFLAQLLRILLAVACISGTTTTGAVAQIPVQSLAVAAKHNQALRQAAAQGLLEADSLTALSCLIAFANGEYSPEEEAFVRRYIESRPGLRPGLAQSIHTQGLLEASGVPMPVVARLRSMFSDPQVTSLRSRRVDPNRAAGEIRVALGRDGLVPDSERLAGVLAAGAESSSPEDRAANLQGKFSLINRVLLELSQKNGIVLKHLIFTENAPLHASIEPGDQKNAPGIKLDRDLLLESDLVLELELMEERQHLLELWQWPHYLARPPAWVSETHKAEVAMEWFRGLSSREQAEYLVSVVRVDTNLDDRRFWRLLVRGLDGSAFAGLVQQVEDSQIREDLNREYRLGHIEELDAVPAILAFLAGEEVLLERGIEAPPPAGAEEIFAAFRPYLVLFTACCGNGIDMRDVSEADVLPVVHALRNGERIEEIPLAALKQFSAPGSDAGPERDLPENPSSLQPEHLSPQLLQLMAFYHEDFADTGQATQFFQELLLRLQNRQRPLRSALGYIRAKSPVYDSHRPGGVELLLGNPSIEGQMERFEANLISGLRVWGSATRPTELCLRRLEDAFAGYLAAIHEAGGGIVYEVQEARYAQVPAQEIWAQFRPDLNLYRREPMPRIEEFAWQGTAQEEEGLGMGTQRPRETRPSSRPSRPARKVKGPEVSEPWAMSAPPLDTLEEAEEPSEADLAEAAEFLRETVLEVDEELLALLGSDKGKRPDRALAEELRQKAQEWVSSPGGRLKAPTMGWSADMEVVWYAILVLDLDAESICSIMRWDRTYLTQILNALKSGLQLPTHTDLFEFARELRSGALHAIQPPADAGMEASKHLILEIAL